MSSYALGVTGVAAVAAVATVAAICSKQIIVAQTAIPFASFT